MLADPLLIICPACTTANRVPRDKLTAHGTCGKCKSRCSPDSR